MGWAMDETNGNQSICLQQRQQKKKKRSILNLKSRQRGKRQLLSQEFAVEEMQGTWRTLPAKRRMQGQEGVSLLG